MADVDLVIKLDRTLLIPQLAPPPTYPPPALINFTVMAISLFQFSVSFDDPGNDADNYVLEYSNSSTFAAGTITSIPLAANHNGTSFYIIGGINTDLMMYCRIRAVNTNGSSPYTISSAIAPPPPALINFMALTTSTNSIMLDWDDPTIWSESYDLDYSDIPGWVPGTIVSTPLPANPAGHTNYNVTGLISGKLYFFRARGVNAASPGQWVYKNQPTL